MPRSRAWLSNGTPQAEAIATKLTTALLGLVAKPVGRRALDAALGPAEKLALKRACRAAVDRVIREQMDAGASKREATHTISLVVRLVSARGAHGVPVVAGSGAVDRATVQDWAATAEELELDPITFPVSFHRADPRPSRPRRATPAGRHGPRWTHIDHRIRRSRMTTVGSKRPGCRSALGRTGIRATAAVSRTCAAPSTWRGRRSRRRCRASSQPSRRWPGCRWLP
jgi:hypothetical protein